MITLLMVISKDAGVKYRHMIGLEGWFRTIRPDTLPLEAIVKQVFTEYYLPNLLQLPDILELLEKILREEMEIEKALKKRVLCDNFTHRNCEKTEKQHSYFNLILVAN